MTSLVVEGLLYPSCVGDAPKVLRGLRVTRWVNAGVRDSRPPVQLLRMAPAVEAEVVVQRSCRETQGSSTVGTISHAYVHCTHR